MNRRELLATATGVAPVPAVAGCSSAADDETGYTYTLTLSDVDERPDRPLDFDAAGLAGGQAAILDEAVRSGTYSEEHVNWDTLPGRAGITMEFRTVIQLIARHVDRDPQVDHETSFGTPCRYGRTAYRATIDVA
ncbi:hypothetical protein [Natrinema salaciae]|uniref:Uncharacterized protein n=1 Tax=Natrinema salaciae TaxID=1186196 RepID=A0A1H9G9E7_9EURY|nr:hypothetical protein [Natrinema salaciae]SEQ46690.1 hypothetical protein SAMN04489841_1817 [Natrinema salaciae]